MLAKSANSLEIKLEKELINLTGLLLIRQFHYSFTQSITDAQVVSL